MNRLLILTAAVAGTTAAAPALAQHPQHAQHPSWYNNSWRTIAYTTVSGHDTDTIQVPGTARYHQVRLCVFHAPIEMRDVKVRFHNGGQQDISTRRLFEAGTCSRNLDLAGKYRDVSSVRMKYTPLARHAARPLVRVQAR
jgi:hypothetical protein